MNIHKDFQCDYCTKPYIDETCIGIRFCADHEVKAWKRDNDCFDGGHEAQECQD